MVIPVDLAVAEVFIRVQVIPVQQAQLVKEMLEVQLIQLVLQEL